MTETQPQGIILAGATDPWFPDGKIYPAIIAIMGELDAIGKNRQNSAPGASFKFRGIDDVYNELNPRFAKHGVFTMPEVLKVDRAIHVTSNNKAMMTTLVTVRYRFIASDGSFVTGTVVGEAFDSGDKSASKAMAIAHKYCLFQGFIIPTEDAKDPDAISHELGGANNAASARRSKPNDSASNKSSAASTPNKAEGPTAKITPKSAPRPANQPAINQPSIEPKATKIERDAIIEAARVQKWEMEQVTAYMKLVFQKGMVTALTKQQATGLLAVIKSTPAANIAHLMHTTKQSGAPRS